MSMKMTMSEFVGLEPCPFCGSKYTQVRYMGFENEPSGFEKGFRGECCDCGALTRAFDTEAEAIATWNARNKVVTKDPEQFENDSVTFAIAANEPVSQGLDLVYAVFRFMSERMTENQYLDFMACVNAILNN